MISCVQDQGELERYDPSELEKEIATDIEMIYSDSAIVEFRIVSPRLEKYYEDNVQVEEFNDGFLIEFFDRDLKVISKLSSKHAKRKSAKGLLILRDSVTYVNDKNDQLETNALMIDELAGTITTTKFFRLIQGTSRDTVYGRGFEATSDFTKLQIKKYLSKRRGIELD